MVEQMEKHPFEDFPRGDLNNGITRRQLLSTLLTELHLYSEKKAGLVGNKLSNLGALEDEQLKDFIPAVVSGIKISHRDDGIWTSPKEGMQAVYLFKVDPISTYTFNLMNGKNTIAEIASRLSQHQAISYERAFSIARGMFLTLVKLQVCFPTNDPFTG